jgi:hypothetical protein
LDVSSQVTPTADDWNHLWELDEELAFLSYDFAQKARDHSVPMAELLNARRKIKRLVDAHRKLARRLEPYIRPIAPSANFGSYGSCTMHGAIWGFAKYIVGFSEPQGMRRNVAAGPLPDINANSHLWNELESSKERLSGTVVDDAFVPAALIGWQGKFGTYKQFKRFLDSTPTIRRRKPHVNRLEIHAADWAKHWASEADRQFEGLDGPLGAEADAVAESVNNRTKAIREAKGRK